MATCTARASVRASAAANLSNVLKRDTREAAAVRGGTLLGNAGGASGNDKNNTK